MEWQSEELSKKSEELPERWPSGSAHGRWHAHFPCPGIQVLRHVCTATWPHNCLVDVSAGRKFKLMKYDPRVTE